MNENDVISRPSMAEILSPILVIPLIMLVVFSVYINFKFTLNIALISVGAALLLTGMLALERIMRRRCIGWTLKNHSLTIFSGIGRRSEMTVNLKRISSAEISQSPLQGLMKCSRVKLCSTASPKPFFNMLLPQEQAVELIDKTANYFGGGEGIKPQYFPKQKYSALTAAVTSSEFTAMLSLAVVICIFSRRDISYLIAAAAVGLLAIIYAVCFLAVECRMSVCRVSFGYVLQKGLFGDRIFVPNRSVIGVIETQTPFDVIMNSSRMQLICAGGKRIYCIHRYSSGNGDETARRLLNCEGQSIAYVKDTRSFKRSRTAVGAAFAAAMAAVIQISDLFAEISGELKYLLGCVLCMAVLIAAVRLLISMRCAEKMGAAISCSSIRFGFVRGINAEYVTLHRGELFAVSLKQNKLERGYGLCRAKFMLRECRLCCKCISLPAERMWAILPRLMRSA